VLASWTNRSCKTTQQKKTISRSEVELAVLAIWDIRSEKSETCAKTSRMGKSPQ